MNTFYNLGLMGSPLFNALLWPKLCVIGVPSNTTLDLYSHSE
jgi:hypothetical protein